MIKLRIILLFILIQSKFFSVHSQDFPRGIDSIDLKLNLLDNDSLKVKYLTDIALKIESNTLELLPYIEASIEIANKLKSPYLIAKSYSAIALVYYFNLNFDKTIIYDKKAEFFYMELGDHESLIENYRRIGRSYYYWGYSDLAIHQLKKAVTTAEKIGYLEDVTNLKREIGYNYLSINELDTAIKYFLESLEIALKYDYQQDIAYDYAEIGYFYHLKKDYYKAISYQKKSIEISTKIKHQHSQNLSYSFIANSYLKIGEIDSAEFYCKKVLDKEIEKLKNDAYIIAAKIYLKKKQPYRALAFSDSAYRFSSKMRNFNILSEVYSVYIDTYKKLGLSNKVEEYKIKQIENYDSIINYNNSQKIKNIEILESIDKSEQNNKLLLEEKIQKEYELKNAKKINIAFLIILLLLVIIIIGGIFTLRKIKLKSNTILNQKKDIETRNEEIKTQSEEISSKNKSLNEKNLILSDTLKKLQEAQIQIIQSEKMASLGVLTAGIAHEINNPVNFISAGVNSIQKDIKDIDIVMKEYNKLKPDTENYIEVITQIEKLKKEYSFDDAYEGLTQTLLDIKIGADRTIDIVKGLRNFSRSDKGEWILSDIHKVIDATLLLLRNKSKDNIEFIKNYDEKLIKIECLSGKLNQAILNIINNAIDAIKDSGKIFISTEMINNFLVLKIKDTGEGIPDKVKEHIFEPFFTTKDVGKGIGIGLSITYGIIKEHNGEIEFKSEIGIGTEFIIKLPIFQKK